MRQQAHQLTHRRPVLADTIDAVRLRLSAKEALPPLQMLLSLRAATPVSLRSLPPAAAGSAGDALPAADQSQSALSLTRESGFEELGARPAADEAALTANSLLRRSARCDGWLPPPLLPLTHRCDYWSEWTWVGDIDRFELVKSARRSCGGQLQWDELAGSSSTNRSSPISDAQLERVVNLVERAEADMEGERFQDALSAFDEALALAPSFTLAWYRAALCAAAVHGPAAFDDGASTPGSPPLAGSGGAALHFLRVAAWLEPANAGLCGNIDLILRIHARCHVPQRLWEVGVRGRTWGLTF